MANINETENLTIGEILRYSLEERQGSRFNAIGIDEVIIDGVHFTDYKAFSFVWEDSYVKSPERSGDGSIENLNSYAWFLTPHLKIDFSLLSIDSYRKLIVDLKHKKREFVVTCYDPTYNQMTTNKMYFPPEELPKLLTIARALNGEQWVELLGVQDYSIELIGTNASFDKVDILYYDENGNPIPEATQSVDKGVEAIIRYNYTPSSGNKFEGVWLTKNGTPINNGEAIRVTEELQLRPQIKPSQNYTLFFSYGKGVEPIMQVGSKPITSIEIVGAVFNGEGEIIKKGEAISTAIARANIITPNGTAFLFPSNGTGLSEVEYEFDNEKKKINGDQVYEFSGWYWTSEENAGAKVTGASLYNYDVNRTIYQIYKEIPHKLTYDTTEYPDIKLDDQFLGFGETVVLPKLSRSGYNFLGWFLVSGNGAPTTMPPHEMTVIAKWEEIK